mmetsp:Transcript_34549/g.42255  ORF Transcript_34549/g.42255 Transcript_34549/m.42255 type:complete len:131 (+) Transcript_34549:372-764(+)
MDLTIEHKLQQHLPDFVFSDSTSKGDDKDKHIQEQLEGNASTGHIRKTSTDEIAKGVKGVQVNGEKYAVKRSDSRSISNERKTNKHGKSCKKRNDTKFARLNTTRSAEAPPISSNPSPAKRARQKSPSSV